MTYRNSFGGVGSGPGKFSNRCRRACPLTGTNRVRCYGSTRERTGSDSSHPRPIPATFPDENLNRLSTVSQPNLCVGYGGRFLRGESIVRVSESPHRHQGNRLQLTCHMSFTDSRTLGLNPSRNHLPFDKLCRVRQSQSVAVDSGSLSGNESIAATSRHGIQTRRLACQTSPRRRYMSLPQP